MNARRGAARREFALPSRRSTIFFFLPIEYNVETHRAKRYCYEIAFHSSEILLRAVGRVRSKVVFRLEKSAHYDSNDSIGYEYTTRWQGFSDTRGSEIISSSEARSATKALSGRIISLRRPRLGLYQRPESRRSRDSVKYYFTLYRSRSARVWPIESHLNVLRQDGDSYESLHLFNRLFSR